MTTSFPQSITTPEAVLRSIDNDYLVLHWFTKLLVQPGVRSQLIREGADATLYPSLRRTAILQGLTCALVLILLTLATLLADYRLLFGEFFLMAAWIRLTRSQTTCIKKLIRPLLDSGFEYRAFSQKTLYQISEFYGQTWRIPSLVDIIADWDNLWRKALLLITATAFLLSGLFMSSPPLDFRALWLGMIFSFYFFLSAQNAWKTAWWLSKSDRQRRDG